MNVVVTAVDSQYIHQNLAVKSLLSNCRGNIRPKLLVCNINQQPHFVLKRLLSAQPEVAAFSCYIWNISFVLTLCEDLKKISPHTKILLGGPEVSFTPFELLNEHNYLDYILCGEGEESFPLLLDTLQNGGELSAVPGLVYREGETILGDGSYQMIKQLDSLPFPYTIDDLNSSYDKIIYYESSRGCPFSCSYCLSGAIGGGVRELPIPRVKEDLTKFCDAGVKLVKFVDRTFNVNPRRAKEILSFILTSTGDMRFHFEIGADLLDDELLSLLCAAPKGKIQLEAGVQSCNQLTLREVVRLTNLQKLRQNALALLSSGRVHLHLDLIAGLPYEDFDSFGESFDDIYRLQPHQLQLGFLKLLKGSVLLKEVDRHQIVFRAYPPYEVLSTAYLSAAELLELKDVEEVLERYYNSGRAVKGCGYLIDSVFFSPFAFYRALAAFCSQRGCLDRPLSAANQFGVLAQFAKPLLCENAYRQFLALTKLDFLSVGSKGAYPAAFDEIKTDASIGDHIRLAKHNGLISSSQAHRAKFDIVPLHPQSLEPVPTLVMVETDRRDPITGKCTVTPLFVIPKSSASGAVDGL